MSVISVITGVMRPIAGLNHSRSHSLNRRCHHSHSHSLSSHHHGKRRHQRPLQWWRRPHSPKGPETRVAALTRVRVLALPPTCPLGKTAPSGQ